MSTMAESSGPRRPLLSSRGTPPNYGSQAQSCLDDEITRTSPMAGSENPSAAQLTRRDSVLQEPGPVTLSWSNINVFVPDKKKKKNTTVEVDAENGTFYSVDANAAQATVNNVEKQIINGVSGVIKPGSLMAILGASGAGKSTLMNVLTNRNLKDYRIEGDVRVNGVCVGSGIRNVSAYVQQDDLFFGTLTVRETLTFRAMLRMDQSIDMKTRMERVEEVILEMGLTKCADTQIGIAGRKKGISGGEAKRLSFACEMLTNPPLMFCDEPTSGLDAYMAGNIVQMLQSMVLKKRTILCTIHQPSSEIFAMFDQILLMAEGRVAFMGSTASALEFLESLNYTCPSNFNPSDFFVMTMAVIPGKEEECRSKVNAICDAFSETKEASDILNSIQEATSESKDNADVIKEAFASESRYEAGWFQQFRSVLWRSSVSLVRDVVLFRVRVLQTLIMAVVVGLIYLRLDYDQKGVMDINGAIFTMITQGSFTNMFAVVNSFPLEVVIFLREYGSGLYRTDVYFLAKNLAELPTFILLPAIFVAIFYWMVGLYEAWDAFLIAMAIVILLSNVAVSFGLIVSTITGDVNIALALAPPLIIPLMMFGGFFLNNDSIPVYFVWLKYISWFNYSNELLSVNQWQDVTSIGCETNETCQFKTGEDVLRYMSFSADNNWLNIGLLLALFVGFRIISFVILLLRAKLSKT